MDTEKTQSGNGEDSSSPEEKKPIIDQMTDLAAAAAGVLAETAVKAGANKARKAVAKRLPRPVKKAAANTIAKAAKAPKKTAKKRTAKKSKKPAKRTKSSARRKPAGKKVAARVAKKKRRRGAGKDGIYFAGKLQQVIEHNPALSLLCLRHSVALPGERAP